MSDASQPGAPEGEEEAPSREGRGFLGRLLGALAPGEEGPEPPPGPAAPSLGLLRRLRVEDVAIPKSEIVAVPVTVPLARLVEVFRESGRTRLPVYEGSLDEPLGAVNLKDVALRHGFGGGREEATPFDLRAMLRPLLYVPPSTPLAALLQRMQAERVHMALVIDEWGGTDGLATIEDLLETVVGEIDDEHDKASPVPFAPEGEGAWVAEGATPLEEIEQEIGWDLTAHESIDPEEVDTLGGLLFLLAGRVPRKGEVVEHPAGVRFEVLDADSRRVKRLRLRLPAA